MYMFWSILLISACLSMAEDTFSAGYPPAAIVKSTLNGEIIGTTLTSRNGRPYTAFLGIPYAKPPVGDLRFKPPQPVDNWPFPYNATKEKPYCIQKNYFFQEKPPVEGSEDCLYLNVYQPQTNNTDPLPVLVYIHWGGFFAGKSDRDYLGPDYLLDKDVIVVTFNYRLGIFGFFSTLDDNVPGNNGMKDQVAALKWVKNNIANFNGDPNKVTIAGTSAGAGSVHLHLVSESSRGLFQRAIAGSGNALALWAEPFNAVQQFMVLPALNKLFACNASVIVIGNISFVTDTAHLTSCLKSKSAEELLNTLDLTKTFSIEPLTLFTLVNETKTQANPEPFLTKRPVEYIQNGEFSNVPLLMSVTKDEGILRASQLLRQSDTRKKLNENFDAIGSNILLLLLSVSPEKVPELWGQMKEFYLGSKNVSEIDVNNPSSVQGFINIYTDRSFVYSAYQSAMLLSAKGLKPWFFELSYRGQYSYGDKWASTNETINFDWGVSHCDDLIYLFKSPSLIPDLVNSKDLEVSRVLVEIYTNFVTNGEPKFGNISWDKVDIPDLQSMNNSRFKFLNITGNYKTSDKIEYNKETGFYPERMKFWSSKAIYENFPGLN